MGLFASTVGLPVLGPLKGLVWIAAKLMEQAEKEIYDEGAMRGRLAELELRYDLGEITGKEYEAREAELLEWLKIIREHQAAMAIEE